MKTVVLGALALLLIGVVALGVAAYRGVPESGPRYDAEVHEQLETAIEARDYEAWLEIRAENGLPVNGKMFRTVNAENFATYAALHDANEAHDTERAAALRAELGLGEGRQNRGMARESLGQGDRQGSGRYARGANTAQRGFVDSDGDGVCDRMPLK